MTCLIKQYTVLVNGYPDVQFLAASPGKARAVAWRSYQSSHSNCTFKQFLKISRVRRAGMPKGWRRILVNGKAAWFLGKRGNGVTFCRDDSETVLYVHEMEVTDLVEDMKS